MKLLFEKGAAGRTGASLPEFELPPESDLPPELLRDRDRLLCEITGMAVNKRSRDVSNDSRSWSRWKTRVG